MTATPTPGSVRRVRITVPPKDGWPETRRGVGSAITCPKCGVTLRGRTHAEARKDLRMHRLECERGVVALEAALLFSIAAIALWLVLTYLPW